MSKQNRDQLWPRFWGNVTLLQLLGWISAGITLMIGSIFLQALMQAEFFPGFSAHAQPPPPYAEALIAAPIFESLFFQGLMQSVMARWVGVWVAFASTTIAFFASHWILNLPVFVAVVVLCYLRMRTNSLGPVMITHSALNLSMYIFTFAMKTS